MQTASVAGGAGRPLVPLDQQPTVKSVHVFRNGDPFYRGRRMLIHEKRVGTFDVFLKDVTGGVQAPFGAVRNIYTPQNGHRINSLDDLQPGECYVAGGRETFKKLDYLHIGEIKRKTVDPLSQVKPVSHSRINVSARFRKNVQEPCTVFLVANGETLNPFVRLLIPRKTLEQWEHVLALVTEKVKLRNGAVHRLYTLEGTPVQNGSELENGQFYVAVGREKFKKLPYSDLIFSKASLRRAHGSKASSLPPNNGFGKSKENRQIKSTGGSSDTVDNMISPQPPKPKGRKHTEPQILNNARVKQNNEHTNSHIIFPVNDDGIFKAGKDRSEMWGASEVQEDENTKVEVPVDQRVAETVEEEEKPSEDNEGSEIGDHCDEDAEVEEENNDNDDDEGEQNHTIENEVHGEETDEVEDHSMVSNEVTTNHGNMSKESEDEVNVGDTETQEGDPQHSQSLEDEEVDAVGHINGELEEREEGSDAHDKKAG
ncbi:doublecortin domain-containing protein 2 isoform X1 [Xenopus laevis]|uniref:Doublecortin domain-containing protein 2 n=1 Tax=Xenopus laevis TaxID=8355 RepID=A0A8J1L537_XENLA|nr:doublecortin domain-containing protein 2 isoform X1 [Xenopus laevis]XP_041423695.1 doublecortin domain-containing protein 2 isoform X1 [Xenopus laevis]